MPWIPYGVWAALESYMHPLPEKFEPLPNQPVEIINETLGFCSRMITLEKAGTYIPQHAHPDDHATLICAGRARGWVDGTWIGDFGPGDLVPVRAGHPHVFQALEDMTRLACLFFDKEA